MPVYNDAPFLNEAIDSILNQTYTDFEFIIVNDGSTDTSGEIIKSYNDPRIKYIENTNNMGIAFSLNRGIENARGEYIARMDGNDVAFDDRFTLQKKCLDNNANIGLVSCNSKVVNESDIFLYNHIKNVHPNDSQVTIFFKNYITHSVVMMRKSILPIPTYNENCHAEDYDLWIKLSQHTQFFVVNKICMQIKITNKGLNETNKSNIILSHKNIIRKQLNRMRINASEWEIDYHYNFHKKNNYTQNEATLIINYFNKLKRANNSYKRFREPAFSKFLKSNWLHVIKRSKINFQLLQSILFSPINKEIITISLVKIIVKGFIFFNTDINIHVVGDSHSKIPWGKIKIPKVLIQVHHLGPKLMYSMGKDKSLCKLDNYNIVESDIIVFSFGEIDCRCHVGKYNELDYKIIINELVNNYFLSIAENTKTISNIKICINNVVPPVKRVDQKHNELPEYPFIGTNEERKKYVNYMNLRLKEMCKENGYIFIDVYNNYCNKEGYLNYELSDTNVHIGDPRFIIKFIKNNILKNRKWLSRIKKHFMLITINENIKYLPTVE